MTNAIERLAAELMNLSNEEWTRVTERWSAGQEWSAVFGPAWDEISERLTQIDWEAVAAVKAEDVPEDHVPHNESMQGIAGSGTA